MTLLEKPQTDRSTDDDNCIIFMRATVTEAGGAETRVNRPVVATGRIDGNSDRTDGHR